MKKLLVFAIVSIVLFSCKEKPKEIVSPNLIYDTLSVSKLVDSVIKETPNLLGNEANKNEAMHKIMYNNFYTIYNNVPVKFDAMGDGIYVEEMKKTYYMVSFHNEFNTKNDNHLSLDVNVIMVENDAKTLQKDSLYVLTGDFNKFQNDEFRGSILEGSSIDNYKYQVMFPMVYLKNDKNKYIPFTFKKISK
jgi:hypothetical protein